MGIHATVFIGEEECITLDQSHTHINCLVPAGEGRSAPIPQTCMHGGLVGNGVKQVTRLSRRQSVRAGNRLTSASTRKLVYAGAYAGNVAHASAWTGPDRTGPDSSTQQYRVKWYSVVHNLHSSTQ